jgi:glutamine transport system substrate-binding protein
MKLGGFNMKKMKLLLVAMMVGVLAIAAGCGNDEEKIKVATDAAYAPFEYMDKGEIVGFDIELLAAVMEEAGIEYEVENTGWEALFAALDSKTVDLSISGISITEKRKQDYEFSSPYFESVNMVVYPESLKIYGMQDLMGKKIGVQNGTTGQIAVEKVLGENHPSINKYKTTALAFMAMKNGEVDMVVTDNTVVAEYVKNNPNEKLKTFTDPTLFTPEYYGLAMPKGSDLKADIDAGLKKVIESGKYAEIYKKWFGVEPNVDVLLNQMQ